MQFLPVQSVNLNTFLLHKKLAKSGRDFVVYIKGRLSYSMVEYVTYNDILLLQYKTILDGNKHL